MYKDRGIIKWAPFDSLVGFNDLINELLYRKGKKDKPILSDDKLEELNRTISIAIKESKEVQIDYYEDGYIKSFSDYIKKIDLINQIIILNSNFKIKVENVVDILI